MGFTPIKSLVIRPGIDATQPERRDDGDADRPAADDDGALTGHDKKEVAEPALKSLVMVIHRDEARWCGVLTKATLAADPGNATAGRLDVGSLG